MFSLPLAGARRRCPTDTGRRFHAGGREPPLRNAPSHRLSRGRKRLSSANERGFCPCSKEVGVCDVFVHVSKKADPYRSLHGDSLETNAFMGWKTVFSATWLRPDNPLLAMPEQGRTILGLLVSPKFSCFLGKVMRRSESWNSRSPRNSPSSTIPAAVLFPAGAFAGPVEILINGEWQRIYEKKESQIPLICHQRSLSGPVTAQDSLGEDADGSLCFLSERFRLGKAWLAGETVSGGLRIGVLS